METIVELPQESRQNRRQISEQLATIESRISDKIRKEFEDEVQSLKGEKDALWAQEKQFRTDAEALLKTLPVGTKIRAKTTWGKNDENVNDYTGEIARVLHLGTFNMITPDKINGKPFTIGTSCLSYIEVL